MGRVIFLSIWSFLLVLLLSGGVALGVTAAALPEEFTVEAGQPLRLSGFGLGTTEKASAKAVSRGICGSHRETVTLLGIPIKTVTVTEAQRPVVQPCGTPFGMELFTNGILVIGTAAISTAEGDRNPAQEAGLQEGDLITAIDGAPVFRTVDLKAALHSSDGRALTLTVQRDERELTCPLQPVKSDFDGNYQGGIWVRDSTAGIGMVTFYDAETGHFAGLGHGICDIDTANLMPLRQGAVMPVCISGVTKGTSGTAGSLKGYFTAEASTGVVLENTEQGVYGTLTAEPVSTEALPIAYKQEITTGAAEILTTIDGTKPERYAVEIQKIDLQNTQGKHMVLQITDSRLLAKTGGIVQGMSGSPILQNGRLVGAVTHVLLQDSTKGYGIFAETMLGHMEGLEQLEDAA